MDFRISWRHINSLISCNWQSQIWSSLSLSLYLCIKYHLFFFFLWISWCAISSSSCDDIISIWYPAIANLNFDNFSLSFPTYKSFILFLVYLMTWNIVSLFCNVIFHWYHEVDNLRFDLLFLFSFVYIYISLLLFLMHLMIWSITFFF